MLDGEHEGLVFGRLDRTDGEVRYVGRIGVRDDDYEPLVIDWRAPAAEPFYRATPTQPMEVVRRRVLRCQGDRVVGIEDDLLDSENADGELVVIGEGALMAALSRARGHQMRDIVATIQGEQDEAIRAPYQGFTLISGGPGTGKTVVGLHRTAYLLYSNRRRFESGGVLVVGPEPGVPQLHRAGAAQPRRGVGDAALDGLGPLRRPAGHRRAPRRPGDAPRSRAACGCSRCSSGSCWSRCADQPLELRVVVQGQVLVLRAQALASIRRDVLAHHKLNAGREAAEKAAAERALALAAVRGRPGARRVRRPGHRPRHVHDVRARLVAHARRDHRAAPPRRPRPDPAAEPGRAERRRTPTCSAPGSPTSSTPGPTVADGALLDELVHLLGPVPPAPEESETSLFLDADSEMSEIVTTADRLSVQREVDPFDLPHRTYAHVLIDEAQDVTPMQWRMLRRRGASASWTIVGDPRAELLARRRRDRPGPARDHRARARCAGSG